MTMTLTNGATVNQSRHAIAEAMLGPIDWTDTMTGFCVCPGEHLHSTRSGKRDCRVNLDGAPTIYCLHTSCAGLVDDKNRALRTLISKAESTGLSSFLGSFRASPEMAAKRQRESADKSLAERAKSALAKILADYAIDEPDLWESSPVRLDDPADDWRLILHLFAPDDVVWIGGTYDSGPGHERNFRPASEWLKCDAAPGNFTCPATFNPGSFSRSNDNVLQRRFLVVESDTFQRGEMLAVIQWLRHTLTLRAVVCTGGKSLHGWFDLPTPENEARLKIMLPAMGCDPALFRHSQPCRLPGAFRAEKNKFQSLLYLSLQ